jgi:hypothetical protein
MVSFDFNGGILSHWDSMGRYSLIRFQWGDMVSFGSNGMYIWYHWDSMGRYSLIRFQWGDMVSFGSNGIYIWSHSDPMGWCILSHWGDMVLFGSNAMYIWYHWELMGRYGLIRIQWDVYIVSFGFNWDVCMFSFHLMGCIYGLIWI